MYDFIALRILSGSETNEFTYYNYCVHSQVSD